jgi:hypothetical protein
MKYFDPSIDPKDNRLKQQSQPAQVKEASRAPNTDPNKTSLMVS